MTLAAIVGISLLAWPFDTLAPGVGGDWGWVAGLSIAADRGLSYGSDLTWTYGPLGFLELPLLYYDAIALVAFAYQWILQLLLAATIYLAGRRSHSAIVAVVVAFAVLALEPSRGVALGFAWCVIALSQSDGAPPGGLVKLFPIAIGALTGAMVFGKLNFGAEMLLLAPIALACRPGRSRRDAASFIVALLLTATAGWFATGQAAGDIWPYVRYGAEIIRGYPAIQGTDLATSLDYGLALLLFAIASALVWANVRSGPWRRRTGLVALWLIYAFSSFKEGFVRSDDAHIALYVSSMLTAIVVLPVPRRRDWGALFAVGVASCLAFIAFLGGIAPFVKRLDPVQNVADAVAQVRTLASPPRRDAIKARLASDARRLYDLPPALVRRIGGRTVASWPYVRGELIYAYGFNWRPLPVLEPQHAYTPALDRLAAGMLESSAAPQRLLRTPMPAAESQLGQMRSPRAATIASYSPPLTTRAIFCRYREIARRASWQLLGHRTDRCGAPRVISVVTAFWGQPVNVPHPTPGAAVLVEVNGVEPSGLESLEALLLRPDARFALLDGAPYRLAPSTASEGLLLSAPPAVDYPPPFAMAADPSTIAVARAGTEPTGTLKYTFLGLPVDSLRTP